MSYSTREIDVPSTVATGGVAGAAAFSGAGGGGCWPFPQAVTLTANAVRMAIRIHGVLKNWLICSSTQKKSDYGHLASAPGGGSLASTERSHQFLMCFWADKRRCCDAASVSVKICRAAAPRSPAHGYRSSSDRRPPRKSVDAAPPTRCRETPPPRCEFESGFGLRPRRHGPRANGFHLPPSAAPAQSASPTARANAARGSQPEPGARLCRQARILVEA